MVVTAHFYTTLEHSETLVRGRASQARVRDHGTSCISVFLGAFDKEKRVSGYTRYNLRNANLGVTTKPRGLVVVVAGPKEQAQGVRDFLSQVNLAKLKGLLP